MNDPRHVTQRVLFLDFRAEGGRAEAFLDDVPVSRVGEANSVGAAGLVRRESKPVQQFVTAGVNHLRVEIESGATRALARLVWFVDGDPANSDEAGHIALELRVPRPIEADVRATTDVGEAESDMAPRLVETAEIDLGPAFGEPVWHSAARLDLDTPVIDRAEAAFQRLAHLLQTGDGAGFVELLGPFLDESVRAYPGVDRAELDRTHREFATVLSAGGQVRIAPRADWQVRRTGGGRLLDIRDEHGDPAVTLVFPDGQEVAYPLLLAWIDGRLLVLR